MVFSFDRSVTQGSIVVVVFFFFVVVVVEKEELEVRLVANVVVGERSGVLERLAVELEHLAFPRDVVHVLYHHLDGADCLGGPHLDRVKD